MKQLIIPDKVQKEMLTDFMILGETRGLIGGYCENEFPVCYANEEMARMLGYDAVEEMVEAIDGKVIHTIHPDDREQVIKDIGVTAGPRRSMMSRALRGRRASDITPSPAPAGAWPLRQSRRRAARRRATECARHTSFLQWIRHMPMTFWCRDAGR